MGSDRIDLRSFQERFSQTALNLIDAKRKIMIANVHPGSGKTIAVLHTANQMFRDKRIDGVAVFVPRLTLCRQFEKDWDDICNLYSLPRMGSIAHRDNNPPLIRGDQFGYVTTYPSLISNASLHLDIFSRRRMLAIFDESQQLGTDEDRGGTQSALMAEQIKELSEFTISMTGTPYRSDGRELLWGTYSDPDSQGVRKLQADVTATYFDGVAGGYLRPFEAIFLKGDAIKEYLLENKSETIETGDIRGGLRYILEDSAFWKSFIDKAIERVRAKQTNHTSFCGLVAACNQTHARKIFEYIQEKHAGVKVTIAVSDDKEALDNLRAFKEPGAYDILVSVRMAYIGYDHKFITIIANLTDYRDPGFLDQLFGRGFRMLPNTTVPHESQMLEIVTPDDADMIRYVNNKRSEAEEGLREREKSAGGGAGVPSQEPFYTIHGARVTDVYAWGMDESGDVNPREYSALDLQRKQIAGLGGAPITALAQLLRLNGVLPNSNGTHAQEDPTPRTNGTSTMTRAEREKKLRADIHTRASYCARLLGQEPKDINSVLFKRYGKPVSECNLTELEERMKWITDVFLPECKAASTKRVQA